MLLEVEKEAGGDPSKERKLDGNSKLGKQALVHSELSSLQGSI